MSKYDEVEFEDIDESPIYDEVEFEDAELDSPEISQTESASRGALQGATLGFGEEIAGGLGSIYDKVMSYIPSTPQNVDAQLADQGFKGDVDKSMLDRYKEQRDLVRDDNKSAEEANSGSYLAGEIAGGLAPAVLGGGAAAVANIGKEGIKQGAKQVIKEGAKFGAADAAGRSEAELLDGEVKEFGKDVAIGATIGAGASVLFPAGIGAIKKSSAKAAAILKGLNKKVQDKMAIYRYISETTGLAFKGLEAIGNEAVSKVQKTRLNKLSRFISNRTKLNRKQANAQITEALKDGDEGVRRLMNDVIENQTDEISRLAAKASSEEGKAGAEAFQKGVKELKAKQLKEGIDPKVLDLRNEAEATQDMLSKQRKDMSVRGDQVMDEKAQIALENRLAKREELPGDLIISRDNVNLPDKQQRDVLQAIGTQNDEAGQSLGRQVVKPGELSPIEKIKVDQDEFLRYGIDGQYKSQRIQPKDIFKDEPPKVQEFFDLIQNFKEALPESGNVARELADIQNNMISQLKEALPVEKAALLDEGFSRLRDLHSMRSKLGKDLGSKFSDDEDKAIAKLSKDLEKFSGMDVEGIAEGQELLEQGLDKFAKSDVSGKGLKKHVKDAAKRKHISDIGQGKESNISFRALNQFGAVAGENIGKAGHYLKKLTSAPKNALNGLAHRANIKGDEKSANFFKSLAEKDSRGRAAIMFTVGQNPELKKTIESYFGEEDE